MTEKEKIAVHNSVQACRMLRELDFTKIDTQTLIPMDGVEWDKSTFVDNEVTKKAAVDYFDSLLERLK